VSRTLSARTDLLKDRSYADPIYLAKVELIAPSALTLYLGDGALAAVSHVAAGQEWLPAVLRFGDVESALESSSQGGSPATFEMVLSNQMPIGGKSRASDLVYSPYNVTGTYVWTGAKVTLYEVLERGAAAADLVTLAIFYIDGAPKFTAREFRVSMIDQSGHIEKKMLLTKVDITSFPDADPDDIGKSIPYVFGDGVIGCKGYGVKTGGITALAAALVFNPPIGSTPGTAPAQTITVLDGRRFGAIGTIGQCLIGSKTADYRRTAVNSLYVYNIVPGTGAAPAGTPVLRVITSFIYVLARNIGDGTAGAGKHLHSAVQNVRNSTLPITATVNLNNTTLVAGKSFVTVAFTVPVATLITRSTGANAPATSQIPITTPYYATNIAGAKIRLLFTAVSSTKTGLFTVTISSIAPPGTITVVRRSIRFRITLVPTTSTAWVIRRDSSTGPVIARGTRLALGETQLFTWSTGTSKSNQTIFFSVTGLGTTPNAIAEFQIIEFKEEVDSTILSPDPNLTVADLVVGNVRADIDGLLDDSVGTLTGTPSQLLTLPADITKLILTGLFGIASGDLATAVWAATRPSQVTAGLVWAFSLDASQFSDLRKKFGEQGQAALFWDSGKAVYKYLTQDPVADLTLDYDTDIIDEGEDTISSTESSLLVNRLSAYWERDLQKSGSLDIIYRSMDIFEDLTIVGFAEAIQEDVELDFIRDDATAAIVGAWMLSRRKRQRFEYEASVVWNALALETVDYVSIRNHPVLQAHGDQLLVFEVRRKRAQASASNPGRVLLGLLEANEGGVELLLNGRFNTDLTSWTLSGATLPVWYSAAAMRCRSALVAPNFSRAIQDVTVVLGGVYRFAYTVLTELPPGGGRAVNLGSTTGASDLYNSANPAADSYTTNVTATTTTISITVQAGVSAAGNILIDNMSLRRIS